VSVRFSSRRPSRPLFRRPASPVQTAAVPVSVFSMPLYLQERLAQLFFLHAVRSRLAPSFTYQLAHRESRGPRTLGRNR
jgi:hypothetical protein